MQKRGSRLKRYSTEVNIHKICIEEKKQPHDPHIPNVLLHAGWGFYWAVSLSDTAEVWGLWPSSLKSWLCYLLNIVQWTSNFNF